MPEQGAEGTEPQEGTPPTDQAPVEGNEPKTFDAEYVSRLRGEAARYRKEAQEAKTRAQEFEDRDKSELEKMTGKLTKAEQAKADAEARLLRYEIATEKQIPADAMDLLTGTTREELEAKADKLLTLVKKPDQAPDFDGGPREPAAPAKSPDNAHNELVTALFGTRND